MVNGFQDVVSAVADGNMRVTAGHLSQVLLWVLAGVSVVFSLVIMRVLKDGRAESDAEGDRRVGFQRDWRNFEDDHIIII